ncbi:CRISPR-associated protein CasB [Lactobacillus acidophilus]|uniref:type I-E CRISPR-associated protein Cse2/CasB n=1 Tax=Lactobacillus acidophilus TaxID=1579 RepID=UPI000F75E9F7|nr:type I-E CRISPR-associated protein Cse2/CasB [Lactobacillus acidophilus]AZN76156.1 CRISPR-associated protein CasB [Lactobacillus acidophilus]
MVKGDWNIAKITNSIIEDKLYDNGRFDKGALANLRGSRSLLSKKATAVMPIILSELPKNDLSVDGTPTYAENAVFMALRCYAIYQQGNDHYVNGSSSDSSKSIFEALAKLSQTDDLRDALDRRMSILLGSTNFNSVSNSIIHLLQILKSHDRNQTLNFALLSRDLYDFQFSSENARKVCLRWGRQYYWHDNGRNEQN